MKLCSACLLGLPCRYDGSSKPNTKVLELSRYELLIPICPEQLGGLATPREAAEQVGSKVLTRSGIDVTQAFVQGAEAVLSIAQLCGVKEAILKQRSPSCGKGQIYDGTFSHTLTKGHGVTCEKLMNAGIHVITEDEIS